LAEFNDFNNNLMAELRANGGKAGGMFEGAPLLILQSTGAKSGQKREIPLVYTSDGDLPVIIASKGGAATNPDWYHNLKAQPRVSIEINGETRQVNAVESTGAERDRLFNQMVSERPDFGKYQENTTRIIPVFVLHPTA
jgi:deazaflavin-dependent oxidoreductase (nitroreductase family)